VTAGNIDCNDTEQRKGRGIAKHSVLYKAERDQLMLVRRIAAQRKAPCPFSKLWIAVRFG
jgi:hypothetical protein